MGICMLELDSVWMFMECDVGMYGGGYIRLSANGAGTDRPPINLIDYAGELAAIKMLLALQDFGTCTPLQLR